MRRPIRLVDGMRTGFRAWIRGKGNSVHRVGGPAEEFDDGTKQWALDGDLRAYQDGTESVMWEPYRDQVIFNEQASFMEFDFPGYGAGKS